MSRVLLTRWVSWHVEQLYTHVDNLPTALAEIHHTAPIAWDAQGLHFGIIEGDKYDPGNGREPVDLDIELDLDIVVTVYRRVDVQRYGVWKVGRVFVLAPHVSGGPDGMDRPSIGRAFDYYHPDDVDKPLGEWRELEPTIPRAHVLTPPAGLPPELT